MDLEQVQGVLGRLDPVLREQGLEVEALGGQGGVLHLRARRLGPGPPMALLVRAVEGTFRRYLPEVRRVVVEGLEEGLEAGDLAAPPPAGPPFRGLPGLDLAGTDRRGAVRALEAFADLVRRRGGGRFRLRGLAEDAPRRAALKWSSFYRQDLGAIHPEGGCPDSWIVHLSGPCPDPETCGVGEEGETLPARVLLVE